MAWALTPGLEALLLLRLVTADSSFPISVAGPLDAVCVLPAARGACGPGLSPLPGSPPRRLLCVVQSSEDQVYPEPQGVGTGPVTLRIYVNSPFIDFMCL